MGETDIPDVAAAVAASDGGPPKRGRDTPVPTNSEHNIILISFATPTYLQLTVGRSANRERGEQRDTIAFVT
eukprot:scaffold82467_cov54-Attheya_sp.AAC.4